MRITIVHIIIFARFFSSFFLTKIFFIVVCDRSFDVTAVSKMAEGVGGLEIALLIIGFFLL